jgi:hypothetical protein
MVDLGSNIVLVVGSNLWTELVPCRGGVDSHFLTLAQSRPAWDQSTFGNCDRWVAVVGKCGSMGCRIRATRVTKGLSLSPRRPTGQLRT